LGALPLDLFFVEVDVAVSGDPRDGVRAHGTVRAECEMACRRCLEPTPVSIEAGLDAWFRPPSKVIPGEEGVWGLDPAAGEVDLRDPVREELWVAAPAYIECSSDCPGLCAHCGARLAVQECTCPPPEPDSRWGALLEQDG